VASAAKSVISQQSCQGAGLPGLRFDANLTIRPLPRGADVLTAALGKCSQVHILSGGLHARLVGGEKKMKQKVLLIEDSKFQRTANGRALIRAGYDVLYAADGEEGLGAAQENIPDLILLDMMLPKMSGLDVLRALKADVLVKHIPVVVLSGLGQANEAKLLKEGAAAFLMKTTESFESNSSALIQALQSLLTGSKA
jgi:CheY-like chemotaxis protein